ncbi:hypothetical protein PVMG_05802 [Plasmodium vivax Mauritania I]|uniref:Uncharacterized protein n=1 Tax=Plasmodium vivax Mauritania I TaxID=1035515 RepID=A0A0J9TIK2_PLAVI|nr:hypothetical protein PVMG_05802 [Plasmodium vivax Mauritania I]
MMKVVKTFLPYCDKNKSNEKLVLFVKEFFHHYYSKNKDKYTKLCWLCPPTSTKNRTHCKI